MAWPLVLPLTQLSRTDVHGIYPDRLPGRMRWLHPTAALSYLLDLADHVVVSDMFRSAESSLWAIQHRKGAARPGRSGHNYGWSIDLDIPKTMARLGLKTKRELDEWMAARGWYCHRRDHRMKWEAWHYNFGVATFLKDTDPRTSWALERLLKATYGAGWRLSAREIQQALRELKLYHGAIDGDLGPLSKTAIRCFQRTWKLVVDAIPGANTQRTLAYVTAERIVVEPE